MNLDGLSLRVLLGRVVDALGNATDHAGPLPTGKVPTPIKSNAPDAHLRQRMAGKIDLGVRAMNTFLTMTKGQRMGIFAGSGVGKSTLMSMLARANTASDVAVIGLIGERGREVQEFLEDDLGEEGLKRASLWWPPVTSRLDAPPGRLYHRGDCRIFSQARQKRDLHDGFGDALCHGAARDRLVRR